MWKLSYQIHSKENHTIIKNDNGSFEIFVGYE